MGLRDNLINSFNHCGITPKKMVSPGGIIMGEIGHRVYPIPEKLIKYSDILFSAGVLIKA